MMIACLLITTLWIGQHEAAHDLPAVNDIRESRRLLKEAENELVGRIYRRDYFGGLYSNQAEMQKLPSCLLRGQVCTFRIQHKRSGSQDGRLLAMGQIKSQISKHFTIADLFPTIHREIESNKTQRDTKEKELERLKKRVRDIRRKFGKKATHSDKTRIEKLEKTIGELNRKIKVQHRQYDQQIKNARHDISINLPVASDSGFKVPVIFMAIVLINDVSWHRDQGVPVLSLETDFVSSEHKKLAHLRYDPPAKPEQPKIVAKSKAADPVRPANSNQYSGSLQAKRWAMMEKLIREGVFQKIEIPGMYAHVWVQPGFYGLTFDQKSSFIGVVYAYYYTNNDAMDIVILKDGLTGKRIGNYMAPLGLDLN